MGNTIGETLDPLSGSGLGVRIGLIDTGVDSQHGDLAGKIAANYEAVMGYDGVFVDQVTVGRDQNQHGTACAGILASLAPDAEIHSVQVIGEQVRDSPDKLIGGIRFAIEQGWEVININAGAGRPHRELQEIIAHAHKAGTLLIAAKDNRPGVIGFPAAYPEVLAVDMEHFADPMSWRYLVDAEIEVEAKGIYVDAPLSGGGRQSFTGASFAAPHIAGIAARLKEKYPHMGMREFREFLRDAAPPAGSERA